MTSKEALNQLYIMADTPEQAMVVQSYYNIVVKDLEILDILKEHLCLGVDVCIQGEWRPAILMDAIPKYDSDFKDNEKYEIVKKWLEDSWT